MTRKIKLQKLLGALANFDDPIKESFKSIDEEMASLALRLKETATLSTIEQVNEQFKKLQTLFRPLMPAFEELKQVIGERDMNLKKAVEERINELRQELSDARGNAKDNVAGLSDEVSKKIREIESEISTLAARKVELPDYTAQIQTVEDRLSSSVASLGKSLRADDFQGQIDILNKDLDSARRMIAQLGGGSMPRQFLVNGSVIATKYADINFKGSGVTYTTANNDTTKRTDLTLTASGGGGGAVTSVISSDGSVTITNPSTVPDLAVAKSPQLSTARTIGGVSFDGTANITVATATGGFTVSGGNLTTSAINIATDTSTGTKFGTATNQKISFYNSTPIVQPTGDVITGLQNLGLMASATVTATTNANLTGPITSTGNATAIASQTGTGTKFVVDTSPTLVTPNIGIATATTVNKVALTAPATSATLTIADGKTVTANISPTFSGADMTFTGSGTNTYTYIGETSTITGIVSNQRSTAQTAAKALTAYTVGAADASFLVSANVLVTTSTVHAFTVTCSYTDEGNTARVLTLQFSSLAGAMVTSIANASGAVPYEGAPLHIRAKANTTIQIASAAGGTYTTVVYNLEGIINRLG